MGLLKKIGKVASKAFKTTGVGALLPGTGRHAAKRAEKQAKAYAAEAATQRQKLEERTKKERARASKLAIRGLRSKRAAGYFKGTAENPSYGNVSETLG